MSLPEPSFTEFGDGMKVIIYRTTKESTGTTKENGEITKENRG